MDRQGNALIFSPSGLNAYLACEHLARLELDVARGLLRRRAVDDPQAELVRRRGDEHELAYLASLEAGGKRVVTIRHGSDDDGSWDLETAAAALDAMRRGAHVVYQAVLLEGGWRGFADFLERVPGASDLGDFHYEVADTKLARHPKPSHLLQLCFYSSVVARLQGRRPQQMHLVLGSQERESFRVDDFDAYYRRVHARFLDFVAREPTTYPLPVPHCSICDWREQCEQRWIDDDHLTLVAGLRRDQAARLEQTGVATLAQLATATEEARPPWMQPRTFETLHEQAELQLAHRLNGEHLTSLLEPEPLRGFELLPPPSPGDLFFDIEGDPFWEPARGLEYLWGIVDTSRRFHAFWAHDRAQEKQALEAVVDFIHDALRRDPTMHVYHYASYEPSALKRLMGEYGTREDEIDDLLRRKVFVDLYKVVRQGLRTSHPDYKLKTIETFYMEREGELQAGDDSILMYEQWLESRDPDVLQAIADYNEEDCLSTLELRDWLLGLRREAEAQYAREIPWLGIEEPREPEETAAETAELRGRLLAGLPDDPLALNTAQCERWLAAHLLDYHRREAKPVWWAFFNRLGRTAEELIELAGDSIGGLELQAREESGEGELCTFMFPAQQHKLGPGEGVYDPATGAGAGEIRELDDERGVLVLYRGPTARERPLPHSLIPGGPLKTKAQRAALCRLGTSIAKGTGRYPALEAILRRELPRISGVVPSDPLPHDDLEAAKRLVRGLDESYLTIQGPPGSGKTFTGARLVVELIRRRRRVGVSATSHKAIENLLREVEEVALEEGVEFRGLKKGSHYKGPFMRTSQSDRKFAQPEEDVFLLAGTAWLFAKEEMEGVVDTLFVEAGQVSLADALAMGTCARNVVFLGRPAAARAGLAGHASRRRGGLRARAPARRGGHAPARARPLPRAHLADASRRLPLRLGDVVREQAHLGREMCAARGRLTRPHGDRSALPRRRARGQQGLVARGGGGDPQAARAPAPGHVHELRRARAAPELRGRACRRAVQRPGALPAREARPAGADRHGRQVPGPGGARSLLLDGNVEPRRPAAEPRVPLLAQPPERRRVAREGARGAGGEPEAARDQLPNRRADADGERALPFRRAR